MIFESLDQLHKGLDGILKTAGDDVRIIDGQKLRSSLIDNLIYTAVFSPDEPVKKAARWLIRKAGAAAGAFLASIAPLYEAMGRGEVKGFTVPAVNIRTLTYDTAQAIFRAAMKDRVGPVLFEIARTEIDYTFQRPEEYTCAVVAAALKVGYRGPVFMQGDHFQINAKKFEKDPDGELKAVKDLIWEALDAGFYNIDIDTSTLVDLSQATVKEQQRTNFSLAAELTTMIRDLEPAGITVSVGGEIGEVGGKNSTVEELRAFMDGYLEELEKGGESLKGISKISVQTGTTHGGVPLPDGSVAEVNLDFEVLERLSRLARETYGLSGAVQHGASTLPEEAFDRFPAIGTAEIHLATGFQNLIYDSPSLPADLRERIYAFIRTELRDEKKDSDTEDQFLYKTRKKGFGPFKRELWHLPFETLAALGGELEERFSFLFKKLSVTNTEDIVHKYVKPFAIPLKAPAGLKG